MDEEEFDRLNQLLATGPAPASAVSQTAAH
jgi:hypothetical protein